MLTVVWFQVFLSNNNDLWFQVFLSNTNNHIIASDYFYLTKIICQAPPTKRVSWIWHKKIYRWISRSGALGNVEYSFIAITFRSTLTRSGNTYYGPIQQVILFTNPSAQVGYDTRSIFKRSLKGLNSEFSFS